MAVDVESRIVADLEQAVATLSGERDTYRKLYLDALELCKRLERGLLAPKKERLTPDDAQLTLQLLNTLLSEAPSPPPEPSEETVRGHTRRRTGRKPLPEHLPRIELEVVPPEVEREGRDAFDKIGEETSETIERRPASTVVVVTRRLKFVRKDRKHISPKGPVLIGAPPELPIAKGLAGPGFLADTIVKRWQDHLPLNRQEQIFAREGLSLARSTICTWHDTLGDLCKPLVDAMADDAMKSPYLCTDATGVLVQAKHKCERSHFWVVVAPERHVLFRYTKNHTQDAVSEILGGYTGYLVADAHTVYEHLYRADVIEVGCWSHARRYFFKAMTTDPGRARAGMAFINHLFRVERTNAGAPRKKRRKVRTEQSAPVLKDFFAWCAAMVEEVVDESPIAKAIRYATNQEDALSRFLEDPDLPIHNNWSERQLRRQAVGRKNWLFVGSHEGGRVNATFTTLLASCQMHGIEPWAYLRDLFYLLPAWPEDRILELAPVNWTQTFENLDTQQRLNANAFRSLLLNTS